MLSQQLNGYVEYFQVMSHQVLQAHQLDVSRSPSYETKPSGSSWLWSMKCCFCHHSHSLKLFLQFQGIHTLKVCSFIHIKSFFCLKKQKQKKRTMTTLIKKKKKSRTCVQHQCQLRLSVPSHLYISNPLCFTFLSPSHGCFFCCSLEACPGFRSEILAQTGEWAILPSSMASPQ